LIKLRLVMAVAVLACLASSCAARDQASEVVLPEISLPFEHYTLSNGLDVILRKDDRVPIASVNIWYHVGPANEIKGRTGFAHLFEHMMLQGSGHAPGDYFERLQAVGATGVNGNTDLDRTSYLEDVPSNQLELALWAESDRMGFLLDALDQTSLSNQQSVIRNERRQTIDNAPYRLGQEEVYHLLFPPDHPYHGFIIGSHQDMQSAQLDDVRAFFKRFYVPNNASLAVVGNIDLARTKALIRKYFGTIPRGAPVPKPSVKTPHLTRQIRKVVTDQVELPRVYMDWITSSAYQPGDAEATITARLFGGGKASRLYKSLVYERKIAQSASATQRSLSHGSVFQIEATAKPGHSAQELEQAIQLELDALARKGPGASELRATKAAMVAVGVKSLEAFATVADRLNSYNHFLGDPGYLNKDLKRYSDVTGGGVKRFVAGQLRKDRKVVVYVVPGNKVLPPDPPAPPVPVAVTAPKPESKEPWRNEVPKAGPAPPAPIPVAKRFELANGLPVYLIRAHALPLVTAQLTSLSGSGADPKGQPGVVDFAAAMLNEGAGKRDALTIANDLTALGATLDTGSSKESSWVVIQSLKRQFPQTLSIMSDVALKPTFPAKEIERVRNDRLVALQQQRDQPATIAFKLMFRELYGPDHPYGHPGIGTEESVKATTRRELLDAYKAAFSPRNAALILTGDLTEAEARRLANGTFGKWKGPSTGSVTPQGGGPGPERVLIVDKPNSPQTTLVLGQLGVARSDPEFEKLEVMNQVLGGLFSSRLNLNLRETKGYTYGISSEVSANRGVGPIDISAAVQAEFTGD
jgi:zinc protease